MRRINENRPDDADLVKKINRIDMRRRMNAGVLLFPGKGTLIEWMVNHEFRPRCAPSESPEPSAISAKGLPDIDEFDDPLSHGKIAVQLDRFIPIERGGDRIADQLPILWSQDIEIKNEATEEAHSYRREDVTNANVFPK